MRTMLLKGNKWTSLEKVDRALPDAEIDGFGWLSYFFKYKITTNQFVLVFPYLGLWPITFNKKFTFFDTTNLPPEVVNDRKIVFWPSELRFFSWQRKDRDIIIGKDKTTTLSYLKEIRLYLLNLYPETHYDFFFHIITPDIYFRRVKRDFQEVFGESSKRRRVLVDFYIVNIKAPLFSRVWFLKKFYWLKEEFILLFSNIFWNYYYKKSLRKGGLLK